MKITVISHSLHLSKNFGLANGRQHTFGLSYCHLSMTFALGSLHANKLYPLVAVASKEPHHHPLGYLAA